MSLNLLFRSVARMRKADVIEERVIREIYAEKTKMNSAEAEFYNAISDNVWDYAASQGVHEGFLMAGAQKMLSSSPQAAFLHWEGKDNLSSEKAEYDNYLPSEACSTGEESSKSGFFDVLRKTALYFEKKDELLAVDSKLNELVKALNFFWQKHPKEKVLLFSFYKITLRYLEKKLKSLGFKVLRYDGDIPNEDRGRIMEDFKKGDYQILLASEIAAEGIDLQFMKCVVNYDLPWNPARVEQRIGRVDRIGQESLKIFVYNLFYRGTIDETVYDRLLSRLGIFERSLGLCEDVVGQLIADLTQDLGVPRETLSLVRSFCSFDDIHHNRKDLPPDVFDSLCALAEGDSLEEVKKLFENSSAENEQAHKQLNSDKEPFAEVNERTQRGFKLLGADDLMEEVTKESLLTWRIFLHPYQKKLVERKSLTPMLVRGVAGTGKTLVALYRANFLAGEIPPNSSQKILLTTFTKNLAEDLSAQLNNICSDEARAKIEVANIDAWVSGFLKQNNCPFNIVYPGSPVYESCWKNAITYADPSAKLDDDFYDTEWRRVILEQGIRTENEYLRAPRRGRGSSITREQRKKAWVVFEEMRSNLEKRHAMTIEDACAMARGILTANPGFANYFSVIVDETQDMNEQALKLLAALAKHTPESEPAIFMVGDAHQRIYARKVSLGACGINVRGRRSTRLKLVYRTTEEIRKLSEKVLLGQTVDDMDEGVEGDQALTSAYSLRHGKAPEIYDAVDEDAQVDWVLDQIRAADCPDNEACVVFRTKEFLKAFKDKLDERRCPNVVIKSSENTTSPGIRLSTMHRVKGLEFKLLFIADCNQGIVPLEKALKSSDKQEKAIKEMTERSLFYVACSRARDKLLISSTGTRSEYLKR